MQSQTRKPVNNVLRGFPKDGIVLQRPTRVRVVDRNWRTCVKEHLLLTSHDTSTRDGQLKNWRSRCINPKLLTCLCPQNHLSPRAARRLGPNRAQCSNFRLRRLHLESQRPMVARPQTLKNLNALKLVYTTFRAHHMVYSLAESAACVLIFTRAPSKVSRTTHFSWVQTLPHIHSIKRFTDSFVRVSLSFGTTRMINRPARLQLRISPTVPYLIKRSRTIVSVCRSSISVSEPNYILVRVQNTQSAQMLIQPLLKPYLVGQALLVVTSTRVVRRHVNIIWEDSRQYPSFVSIFHLLKAKRDTQRPDF